MAVVERRAVRGAGGCSMVGFVKIGKDKITGRVVFKVSKTSPAFLNALRRSIMENVPTMAVEMVEFRKNNSILYDEFLAHRLGLIPLSTDLKSYKEWDKKTSLDDAPASMALHLTLKAKGPKIVFAKDLKSKDPAVKPVYGDMPIVSLLDGQELEFDAVAVLGRGSEHSKFCPGRSWYRHYPNIKINDKLVDNPDSFIDSSPLKIFRVSGGRVVVDKEKFDEALVNNASFESVDGGPVSVEDSPDEFIFHYEPWGQLSPKESLETALKNLANDFEDLQSSVKESS